MKKLAFLLAGLALIVYAPRARADYEISVNGTACSGPTASGTPNITATCASVSASGVTITNLDLQGIQGAANSQELGSTLSIVNTSGSSETVTIYLSDSNFTAPTTPPDIIDSSEVSFTSTVGTGTVALTSCVDESNSATAFCTTPATGEAGANTTLNFSGSDSGNNTTTGLITSLTQPFSLEQEITVTLSAGATMNVNTSQVLSPVPEPASLALLGTGLLLLAGFARKKLFART